MNFKSANRPDNQFVLCFIIIWTLQFREIWFRTVLDNIRYNDFFPTCNQCNTNENLKFPILVPPHLGPLVFPVGTREGMRAQSTCFVQEGDLPIEIYWEKDGARLKPSAEVKMTHVDDFTSMLTISNAQAEHSGNYTCFAMNAASSVAASAQLSVNGDFKCSCTCFYYL